MNGFDNRAGCIWAVRPDMLGRIAAVLREPGMRMAPTSADGLKAAADASASEEKPGGVAVIPLHGLITPRASLIGMLFGGGGGLEAFRENLKAALASKDVSQIVLDVDSPGGSTDLVNETAAEVRAARQVKPITAVANTMAASAAYDIAAQANELVVTPSGDVGSIGVFAVHEDWSGFNEQFGVEPTYVSAGKFKTELNPDSPLSEEGRKDLQAAVDYHYDLFLHDVAAGRGVSVDTVRNGFGEGRVVTAGEALSLGMVDRVDTLEGTLSRMAQAQEPTPAPTAAASGSPTFSWNVPAITWATTTPTSAVPEDQPDDKPDPKEQSEEDRARIGRLVSAAPQHLPDKE